MKKKTISLVFLMTLLFTLLIASTTASAASDVVLSNMKYPVKIVTLGSSQSIAGTIKSTNGKIKRIEIGIVKGGDWLKGHKVDTSVNAMTYNIAKEANPKIKFSDLVKGTYYYRCVIWRNGKAATAFNRKFVVANKKFAYYDDDYTGYAYSQFGWGNFTKSGCFVTSAAMVTSNKKVKKITPDDFFTAARFKKSYTCPDLKWKNLGYATKKYGLTYGYKRINSVAQAKTYARKYPQGVIVNYKYSGGYHYVVLRYKGGEYYYNDPGNYNVAGGVHLKSFGECYGSGKAIQQVIWIN